MGKRQAYPNGEYAQYVALAPLGTPLASGDYTPAGNAATKIPTTDATQRDFIEIFNASNVYGLYIKKVADGATAPTISTSSAHYYIPPLSTLCLLASAGTDFYAQNSSGAATTSACTVVESTYGN